MEDNATVAGTETPTTTIVEDTEAEPDIAEDAQDVVDNAEIAREGGDIIEGEHVEEEHMEGEYIEGEHLEGEHIEKKEKVLGEGEELEGEEVQGEHVVEEETKTEAQTEEEMVEEEQFVEEPPPDPAAPLDFSDSKEALRDPFVLRNDQLVEVELLWEMYQNYTPAYTDIENYITEKELVYMLKSLFLMTYTPEQLMELISFCVRPPHPKGHITYEQFLKMVTLRQRDLPIEEELRFALQVFDPDNTGQVDREYLKETLAKQGHKMPPRQLENLIKEVDISNDGTIGIEDVIGTMCIDLNKEDLLMLREALNPNAAAAAQDDENV